MRLTKTYLRRLIKEEVNLILKEQEDGTPNKAEDRGVAALRRLNAWGSKLNQKVYSQFLLNVKKAIGDAEASVSWVAEDPEGLYNRIMTVTQLATKGGVKQPKQALQFENEADSLVDLKKYGYPTIPGAGAYVQQP